MLIFMTLLSMMLTRCHRMQLAKAMTLSKDLDVPTHATDRHLIRSQRSSLVGTDDRRATEGLDRW